MILLGTEDLNPSLLLLKLFTSLQMSIGQQTQHFLKKCIHAHSNLSDLLTSTNAQPMYWPAPHP